MIPSCRAFTALSKLHTACSLHSVDTVQRLSQLDWTAPNASSGFLKEKKSFKQQWCNQSRDGFKAELRTVLSSRSLTRPASFIWSWMSHPHPDLWSPWAHSAETSCCCSADSWGETRSDAMCRRSSAGGLKHTWNTAAATSAKLWS